MMFADADQFFVRLKATWVALFPGQMQALVSVTTNAVAIVGTFALLFAVTTLLERKGLGRMQNRYGPNRVGPWGLLQPLADGLKMLIKEDIVPTGADRVVHFLAPVTLVLCVILGFAVIPMGHNMAATDLDAGLVFFFAAGAGSEVAVFMAGWASRSKYPLLGAMRAIAQVISYEMPLVLSAVAVVMMAGTLSLVGIVQSQEGYHWGWLARWHVFTPWGLAGFLLFFTAALAESNRSPFDIPEGESEIIAGHMVEYSGFKYALFFLGEYLGLFALAGLGSTLFLGGYLPPLAFLNWVPSWIWFLFKLMMLVSVFIWLRGTMPRLRADQLMEFAWKFLLPMSLFNLVIAGAWKFSRTWSVPGGNLSRWLMGAALLALAYLALSRLFQARHKPRVYRYV